MQVQGVKRKFDDFNNDWMPQQKFQLTSVSRCIFPLLRLLDAIPLSQTCRTWRVEYGKHLTGIQAASQQFAQIFPCNPPKAYLNIATTLYELEQHDAKVIVLIHRLVNRVRGAPSPFKHLLIDCDLLQARVAIYRPLPREHCMSVDVDKVHQMLVRVEKDRAATPEQRTHAFCIEALLSGRGLVDNAESRQQLRRRLRRICRNEKASETQKGLAQYGCAILDFYEEDRPQKACLANNRIFTLFQGVNGNLELPNDMRADAKFLMARLRILGEITEETLSFGEAFNILRDTTRVASAALLKYKDAAWCYMPMAAIDDPLGDVLMTYEQSFSAFERFLNLPEGKTTLVDYAFVGMARLRVLEGVGTDRMNERQAIEILMAFSDHKAYERMCWLCLHILNAQGCEMLNLQSSSNYEKVFDNLASFAACKTILMRYRAASRYAMALLRCRNLVHDDKLTIDQAFRHFQEASRILNGNSISRHCDFWCEKLRLDGLVTETGMHTPA